MQRCIDSTADGIMIPRPVSKIKARARHCCGLRTSTGLLQHFRRQQFPDAGAVYDRAFFPGSRRYRGPVRACSQDLVFAISRQWHRITLTAFVYEIEEKSCRLRPVRCLPRYRIDSTAFICNAPAKIRTTEPCKRPG